MSSTWVLGSWDTATVIALPYIPQLVSEWAAIIPLVCHLANYKQGHELVGQLALSGRLHVDIFPKLGVLYGLSKLLRKGTEYIDYASTKGSQNWAVWDVRWGSNFPCANGGASSMVLQHAVGGPVITMPDRLPDQSVQIAAPAPAMPAASKLTPSTIDPSSISPCGLTDIDEVTTTFNAKRSGTVSQSVPVADSAQTSFQSKAEPPAKGHRRIQTLRVLHFAKQNARVSWLGRLNNLVRSHAWQLLSNVCMLCATAAIFALGLYGTVVIMLCGIIAQIGCRLAKIERPPGYLQSNESEEQTFMLLGLHQNTSTWSLFTGDRGIIDSLLNKPMVAVSVSRWSIPVAWLLRCSHAVQLIAMTFVAGQKGWDGVVLVILMVINTVSRYTSDDSLVVRQWLESEGINVQVKTFEFTGRTMMLGAIQEFSQSQCESWMDGIVPPHPRRNAWLARLRVLSGQKSCATEDVLNNDSGHWSQHDWKSIIISSELAHLSASVLKREFSGRASV